MLIAAMILGLIGGISYFIGGTTYIVSTDDYPWWGISLIPIGLVGAIGSALVLWKPNQQLSAILLLLACVSAIVVGIISFEEAAVHKSSYLSAPPITTHAFGGFILYQPLPLFALIVGGALAIAGRQRRVEN